MRAARSLVRHTLRSCGASTDIVERVVLASAEAFNNVVMHAAGATFGVRIAIDSGCCTVVVTDAGRGFRRPRRLKMPAFDALGHRGLALMEALVDEVDVDSSRSGTRIGLVQSLTDDLPALISKN